MFHLGNQVCSRCHDLEKEHNTLKTKMESGQKKIKHTEKEETLEKEKDDGETKVTDLKEASARRKNLGFEHGVKIVDLVEEINDDSEVRHRGEMEEKAKVYNTKIQEMKLKEENMRKQHACEKKESNKKIKKLKTENERLKEENKQIKSVGNKLRKFEKVRNERDQLSSKKEQLDEQVSKLQEHNVKYRKFNHYCFQ